MSYLLDTDICIYRLNGRQSVKDKLLRVGWEQVTTSVITQAELYYGAYKSSRVVENLSRVDAFVKEIFVLSFRATAGQPDSRRGPGLGLHRAKPGAGGLRDNPLQIEHPDDCAVGEFAAG